MLANMPLELTTASMRDVRGPITILLALVLIAAALSTRPVLVTSVMTVLFTAGWGALILGLSKVSIENLLLIISSDGRVRLKLHGEDSIRGVLVGQQWCSYPFAILRIGTEKMTQNLLVISTQQKDPDDFRRLNMWLKQDFHRGVQEA